MTKTRIEELRRELEYHNQKYYIENAPQISDQQFDALMRELMDLESANPQFTDPNSPSVRVGNDSTNEFQSATHNTPMLSLSNTYSIDELREFVDRIEREVGHTEFVCELKFDGTAISLTYKDGELERAVTRGDGLRGDLVTANVRTIRTIPLKLNGQGWPSNFEIRGEIYLPYSSFDRINAEREAAGEPLMANPRNAAAGTLKQQASSVVARRGLDCTLYQLAGDGLPYSTHLENLNAANSWGFKTSQAMQLCQNAEQIQAFIERWDKQRHSLPFATDGVVVKVNNYATQRTLGSTAKAPRWAVAYKFKAEKMLTRVLSIDFQVGRTGVVTPVANLDAVALAGTVVRRATLHNADQIAMLDIRINDMVYVEKGGEIIPKITEVEFDQRPSDSQPLQYPKVCPVCGTMLEREASEAKVYCPNRDGCKPQIVGRIIHFIRRKAMDIDGLGQETVELLFDQNLVRNIADIYDLRAEQLAELPRLGEKSAENIMRSIHTSLEVPFERVLFALGISFVGETTAKYLAESFRTLDALIAASELELTQTEEVGARIANSIVEFFANEQNVKLIERLRKAGLRTQAQEKQQLSASLEGMNFVVSGKFTLHSRDELKKLIESHGGRNVAGVSGNVDYIIAGDNMGPEKLRKAEKLGVKIITEGQFDQMIGSDAPQKTEAIEPIQRSLF